MKVGKGVRTKPMRCLGCGRGDLDGATAVGDTGWKRPKPGDATVCLYCGHLMMFGDDLEAREPTSAELYELAGDERLVMMMRARAEVMAQWQNKDEDGGS